MRKNKKGLSEIIAYVLLISIAVAISLLVYPWLKSYISVSDDKPVCHEGVAIIIKNYSCDASIKQLNLSLQNKGLFTIKGFLVKTNSRANADFGINSINDSGVSLEVGEEVYGVYDLTDIPTPALVEVQAFESDSKNPKILCRAVTQKIQC